MTPYKLAGIQCGNGWSSLYKPLIKSCKAEGTEIHQIKEKFGGLRFYVDSNASSKLHAAILDAERRSFQICEICGYPAHCVKRSMFSLRDAKHTVEPLPHRQMN